jgi:hypothetical protein
MASGDDEKKARKAKNIENIAENSASAEAWQRGVA